MGETINIIEYLNIFKKRKKIVFIILLIFMLGGGLLQYKNNKSYIPTYTSNVSVRINVDKNTRLNKKDDKDDEKNNNTSDNTNYYNSSIANSTLNQNIATSYYSLATSKRAITELIKKLDLKVTPEMLASSITVKTQENIPEFIDISVTNANSKLAQKIAKSMPEVFNNELKKVIGLDCVDVLYDASEGLLDQRERDNTFINATLIGIVLAIFVVLLLECLDNKVVTPEDAEKYWEIPVIGIVPYEKENTKGKKAIV